jgi:serine/arginine repetitive matrix protein 2
MTIRLVSNSTYAKLVLAADDTIAAVFRVGMVESVSTPPAVSSERRLSYTGQTAFANNSLDQQQRSLASPASQDRILSGLQAPLTEATRSSYMTSSTLSRMSNLSDFPAPPKDGSRLAPKHMSLLSAYFDEAMSNNETQSGALPAASSTSLEEDRVTFGGNQSANDLAKTLSTPQPEPF